MVYMDVFLAGKVFLLSDATSSSSYCCFAVLWFFAVYLDQRYVDRLVFPCIWDAVDYLIVIVKPTRNFPG